MTTKVGFKILTIQVPNEVDTSEIEGMRIPSDKARAAVVMLQFWRDIARKKEADLVPADSPLACVRCNDYRSNHCSLCKEQVCFWCHWPDKDHHGGKVRPLHVHSKTYVLTDPETGDLVSHQPLGKDENNSYYIHEPLSGPCATCGHEGHINRLLYRDPDHAPPSMKGVAFQAICYACGAGNGNLEPVLWLVA